ncbi:relaxase/mobilization nuclease domain-containing protein [Couchioplanes caeruleus]|uniref:Relaxase n=2 Tax=Couchioplanes caeruleus TaxID=56438 RepID=A0A1K0GYK4_9ACTN|nr:relaxase [Couchioplanes caeruleus]OJF14515.1 relaxase [Couchioplanes caeruleus subsp. caeruleus]ROP21215.1 hypothetical protein EDD30_7609 [Couchioplanes caeruleus]
MIPKVTKGTRVRGLLEYLWGPGKAEEHTNPRIVAGYDDPAVLAPPVDPSAPGRWLLGELAAKLDAPQEALGDRGIDEYVLQVALSVRVDEREISDAEWSKIAHRYVEEMGFAGDAERAGCRWIAVHHGRSVNGNDHIHLVITRATEDGAPVYLRGEWKQSQQVCDRIEDVFGLRKDTPGRAGATTRPAENRPEIDQARTAGRRVTDRQLLRREVRAALAGAKDEADWVARMKAAGLLVAARADADDPAKTVGYAVALPPERRAGKPRWLSGRLLDQDLSLHRVRQRWPSGERLSAQQWKDAVPREHRVLAGPQRVGVWRATAAALEDITARMAAVAPGSAEWPAIARASADALAVTAVIAESSGQGPVSRAADILARAAAPKRSGPAPETSTIAAELARVSDAITIAGAARHSREAAAVVALMVAAARLIVALARLREAQQDAHAAGAARVAAEQMMPLLRQAHEVRQGPPASAPAAPEPVRAGTPAVTPVRPSVPGPRRERVAEREER